jgi:hypothetical protein
MVAIICPLPGWNRVKVAAKTWWELKLCQNKKDQMFAEMLIFLILFLDLSQLSAAKKSDSKNEHLALLILSGL